MLRVGEIDERDVSKREDLSRWVIRQWDEGVRIREHGEMRNLMLEIDEYGRRAVEERGEDSVKV